MVELRYLENTLKRTQERFAPMARSPLILDRYRVIDQAGSGGYGTVVHARHASQARCGHQVHRAFRGRAGRCSPRGLGGAHGGGFGRGRGGGIGRRDGGSLAGMRVRRSLGRRCSLGHWCSLGAAAGDPAGSSSADAFPADPDFLAARDERRRRRSATAATSRRVASEEVPPWEEWDDAAAEEDVEGEGEWEDSLIPWNASTTDFAGRRRGPARLTGRVSRKTRHAPEVPLRTPDRGRRGARCH